VCLFVGNKGQIFSKLEAMMKAYTSADLTFYFVL